MSQADGDCGGGRRTDTLGSGSSAAPPGNLCAEAARHDPTGNAPAAFKDRGTTGVLSHPVALPAGE